jgi:hypothetical protein
VTEAIVALVVVLLAGCAFLAYRHRSERGIESGISSFRRELSALAPRRDPNAAATDPRPRVLDDDRRAATDGTAPAGDAADADDARAIDDAAADDDDDGAAAGEVADGDGPAAADR